MCAVASFLAIMHSGNPDLFVAFMVFLPPALLLSATSIGMSIRLILRRIAARRAELRAQAELLPTAVRCSARVPRVLSMLLKQDGVGFQSPSLNSRLRTWVLTYKYSYGTHEYSRPSADLPQLPPPRLVDLLLLGAHG